MELLRPMLAAKSTDADLQRLRFPVLASPKIDGIRAMVVNGVLVSRTLKPIRNYHTQCILGLHEFNGLDGELVVGNAWDKNLMQQTSSGVMSFDGMPQVTYHVFDKWDMDAAYNRRLMAALNLCGGPIRAVIHKTLYSYEKLLEYERQCLLDGYEGVMVRDPLGKYKQNRSTIREGGLIKVKRFDDAEAIIRGTVALNRNLNEATLDERGYTKRSHSNDGKVADDLLGSLLVEDVDTGVRFSVGSGFTDSQRRSLWKEREGLLGRIVKYKSFKNAGVKDAPRHPIFLGFRDKDDM